MPFSKCPRCDAHSFEFKEAKPTDSIYQIIFVQCASCGTVVGTMPYHDAGILSKDNQHKLTQMSLQLDRIETCLQQLIRAQGG